MPPKVHEITPGGPSAHPAASTPNGPKHKYSNAEKRAYRKSLGLPKKKSKATKAKAKAKRAEAKANAKTRRDEWARLTPEEKHVIKEASETAFRAKHFNWTLEQWNRRQEKHDKWRAQETKKYQERQEKRDRQKYQDDIAQAEDENHDFEESQEGAEDDRNAQHKWYNNSDEWGKPEDRKAVYEEYARQAEPGEYPKQDYLGGGKAAQMRNKSVTPPEDDGLFEPENLPTLSQNKIYGVPSEYEIA